MTESEIDEMIKHLEEVEITSLIPALQSYKEIFIYLNNIFSPLLEKNRSYDSSESKLDQLINKDVLDKLDSLYKEFNQQNNIIIDYKHKLLHAKRDEITVFESNKIQQTLTEVTQKLREIHTKVLEIEGINGLLANILAENLSKTTSLSKELEDKINLSEKLTSDKIDKIEEAILKKAVVDDANHLKREALFLLLSSIFWLVGIVVASILLICLAFQNIQDLNVNKLSELKPILENNNVFWIYVFSRLSMGIILIYFLFFAIKNYRSIKHTEFIYKQKATALQTYVFLSRNPSTKGYERELVSQIGRSVFEIHQTGYIKENQDKNAVENVDLSAIPEIIRAAKQ